MLKMSDLAVVAAVTSVLTLGLAAAQARDTRPRPTESPAATAATPEQLEQIAQTTADRIAEAPSSDPCARKVKVVYSGYGEIERACAAR